MTKLLNLTCAALFTLSVIAAKPFHRTHHRSSKEQIIDSLMEVKTKITGSLTLVPRLNIDSNGKEWQVQHQPIEGLACKAVKSLETLSGPEKEHFAKLIRQLSAFSHNVTCTLNAKERYDMNTAINELELAFKSNLTTVHLKN